MQLFIVISLISLVTVKGELLLQLPRSKLTNLIDAEVLSTFPRGNAVKIDTGLWAIQNSDVKIQSDSDLDLDSGFVERAFKQLTPICSSPDDLVVETAKLSLRGHNWSMNSICISHYHVDNKGFSAGQHFAKPRQINAKMLQCALAQTIHGPPRIMFQDKDKPYKPNWTILEFHRGFILAEELHRRQSKEEGWYELSRLWKRRPYNFSAALNAEVARIALCVAVKMRGN